MSVLLKNILAAFPDGDNDVIRETDIYIENRTITGIGDMPSGFLADEIIDGSDTLAIPGLINCHTHSYMAFMRNAADDLSFADWLFGRIEPMEDVMTDEDTYWGAALAITEMLKSGTTCFNDMQMNIHQTTRAVRESGIRAVVCRGLVGSGDDEAGRTRLAQAYEERDAAADCDRLTFMLGPHAPYSCDEDFLRIVAGHAARENMGIHTHLSESLFEVSTIKEKYGCSPIALAERAGLFDHGPVIAAHCVQIDDEDIAILKKHDVSVVTNPASNMKLGNGFAPVQKMLDAGINVTLGTDGAASNNSLNLFHELSLLTLIHKGAGATPQSVSAREGFRIATINGARALGLDKITGSIEIGKRADLALIDLNTPSLNPRNDLLSALSYSANGSEVRDVMVDGRFLVRDHKLLTMDETLIYKKVNAIMDRIQKQVAK